LGAGQFTNAERAPFVTGKAPGLDINGDGRGCNTLGGRFAIKTLTWTSAGTVAEMDVLFGSIARAWARLCGASCGLRRS